MLELRQGRTAVSHFCDTQVCDTEVSPRHTHRGNSAPKRTELEGAQVAGEAGILPEGFVAGSSTAIKFLRGSPFRVRVVVRCTGLDIVRPVGALNIGNASYLVCHSSGIALWGNPLFNEAAVLNAWLEVRQTDAGNFVFNSQKSTRLDRVTIYKLFKAIARKAELGGEL